MSVVKLRMASFFGALRNLREFPLELKTTYTKASVKPGLAHGIRIAPHVAVHFLSRLGSTISAGSTPRRRTRPVNADLRQFNPNR